MPEKNLNGSNLLFRGSNKGSDGWIARKVVTDAKLEFLINKLAEDSAFAVFAPTDDYNIASRCLRSVSCPSIAKALLVVQATDWFLLKLRDNSTNKYLSVIESWRQRQDEVFPKNVYVVKNNQGEHVTVRYVPSSANRLMGLESYPG